MELINGCDHLFMPFVYSCVLLLVVFHVLYIFIVGGVGRVYTYGLVVDWMRLCFGFVR